MFDGATIAILLGVMAAISYGVADFLGAKAAKDSDAFSAALCISAVGTFGFAVWYLTQLSGLPAVTASGIWYALAAGILIASGLAFLYKAFAIGPVSLASPLGAAYPLVATLLGVVLFGAVITIAQGLGILLIVGGVMVASGLLSVGKRDKKIGRGPAYALLASLLWGLGYPLLYQSIDSIGWQHATMIQSVILVATLTIFVLSSGQHYPVSAGKIKRLLTNEVILIAGAVQLSAILAINIGLSYESASGALVTAASAMYPAITMVLALRHFDEGVDWVPLAGAVVSIIGVATLSMG